ncbi:hypothetical protein N7478_005470 [Penicillium angulare]|uniref:uncharacterized protein n=1 Tax=Penicillium angulare TaxID=116970 RepID=UPI0025420C50|nr:uncharacterized protein N7478_005470 [Penicillium angulare]KAJ5280098.1 hypothetical protein N7478_005470 [Penicillium angulare]
MARKRAVDGGRTRPLGGRTSNPAVAADEELKRMSSPGSPERVSPPKKTPRKAAPWGKWSEEQLLTSDKSVLIDADLVKLLASSASWHCLEENEKRQILDLLPSDIHPNPDPPADDPTAAIPPLPDSFVRYSNNWRDGIRQFQLDLQNGRYDPDWLRQADEARLERQNGAFDSFKEREYEQFWGQKQKSDTRLATGEAGRIRLNTLVAKGVIRVGDVWRFTYVYGKGADRILIDKETRIQEINGSKLTFVMPGRQEVFLKSKLTDSPKNNPEEHDNISHQVENKGLEDTNKSITEASNQPCQQEQAALQPTPTSDQSASPDAEDVEYDLPVNSNNEQSEEPIQTSNDKGGTANWIGKDFFTSSPLSSPPPSLPTSSPPKQSIRTNPVAPERQSNVEVVIFSPHKASDETLKRSIPQPAVEPLPKRKKGRPRKVPIDHELSEVQDIPEIEDKPLYKEEPEASPEAKPMPASRQTVQVVLESTPNLTPKPEPITETHKPEKSIEDSIPLHSGNTSAEAIKYPPIFELPGPSDIPMDVPPSTRPDELDITNNVQSDLNFTPKDTQEVALQTNPTPSTSLPITEQSSIAPEEVVVREITNPMMLAKRILAVDGRKKDSRTANAWKEIRCYRDNQDMGSLWDVRQAWFLKQK